MKKEDLESTMPIKSLKDLENQTRSSRYLEDDIEEEITRSSRLKAKEEEEVKKEQDEAAEEALAEKNINEAEELLQEEKEEETEEETVEESKEESKDKKDNIFKKLIAKYNKLTKKGKIIFFSIIGVVVILIIILLIVLLDKEEPVKKEEPKEEVPIVIVDNYYYKDGSLYLLDNDENEIGTYKCENADEKLCYVAYNKITDDFDIDVYLDSNNNEVEQRIPIINNQYAFIVDKENTNDNSINMYDIKEEKTIDNYQEVKYYAKNNYYIFKDEDNKYGLGEFTDTEYKILIKPTYEYLGMIENKDNLVAKTNKGYIIINSSNKTLSEPLNSGLITNYSKDLIIVKLKDEYSAYNYEGTLIETGYDFIKVIDGYMAIVKDKKLYIRDTENNKYNEDGITLKNTNYINTYIYNEDKSTLKETKKSFELESTDTYITITIFDNDTSTYQNIETNYASVNKKYNYVNYFDKKLYFYRDEEKTDLIGSYTCNFKNFTESITDSYDKCYIAYDTTFESNDMTESVQPGITSIYNERYVFIQDGSNIYLYDLVNKKSLGTYLAVSTYSNNLSITHEEGTFKVILKNTKNKFGMVEITSSSASKVYDYKYTSMEKLGDYILAQKENQKWVLLTGTVVSNEYPNKILSYNSSKNLFKVKTSSGYEVYNAEAKKLGTSFKYAEIEANYFVGIDSSNKLNIYDTTGKEILTHSIEVKGSDYTGSTPSYIVSYANNIYTINIKNGETYDEHKFNTSTNSFIGEETEEEPQEETE